MVKVLVLNGSRNASLTEKDGFKTTTETFLGNNDPYKAPEETLKRIAERTKNGDFDVVIVQNNTGIGVDKVKAVAHEMRSKVIVVWNDEPATSSKSPYIELGVKYFTSISNLRECLDELVKGGGK